MSSTREYNESLLLQQVAEGDAAAFREIFDHYRQKLYALGMYLTKSEILAEEIVQDVFLKVWEKRAQLASLGYFNAWLRTVAKNTCSNYLRAMAVEKLGLDQLEVQTSSSDTDPEHIFTAKEFTAIVNAAVEQLPPQQKKVYLLAKREGKKQDAIASEMNISLYTVKEYQKLAQRSIKKYLEHKLDILLMSAIALYL